MRTLQEEMLKNFNPVVSIEIKDIGMGRKSEVILVEIFQSLAKRYKILIDEKNDIIYVGK